MAQDERAWETPLYHQKRGRVGPNDVHCHDICRPSGESYSRNSGVSAALDDRRGILRLVPVGMDGEKIQEGHE